MLVSADEAAGGISLGGGRGRVGSLTELHMASLESILDGYTAGAYTRPLLSST